MKHMHEELTCQAMPLRWFGIPRRTNSFTFKENLKKNSQSFIWTFFFQKAHYIKWPQYSKYALIWFSGKDPLITNITNWNKIATVLHQLHRKYSHIFATWLWLFSAPPAFQSISTCWSSLISFLQKSLIDCKRISDWQAGTNCGASSQQVRPRIISS